MQGPFLHAVRLPSRKRVLGVMALAIGLVPSSGGTTPAAMPISAPSTAPADIPYDLPVTLPPRVRSPAVAPDAPFTPTVRRLLEQLLPGEHPSAARIRAATALLVAGGDDRGSTCHNQARMRPPGETVPAIAPLWFADGLGINVLNGPSTGAPLACRLWSPWWRPSISSSPKRSGSMLASRGRKP